MPNRVLVVEDDPKVAELLGRFLGDEYEVLVARDGREAVAIAQASRPGLILLDVGLPKLDGLNALRLLKTTASTADIPVVMQSAMGQSDALMEAETLGAVDYLIKPYTAEDVVAMVRKYLVPWKDG